VSKRMVKILPAIGLATGLACGLAAGAAWAADSPFIGEWKLVPAKTRMPDEFNVENKGGGKYTFDFGGGVGAETIVADGSGQPGVYGTLLSVKHEAPDTWIVERKKDGRLMLHATWKLAKDGRTLTDYFRQFGASGAVYSVDFVYRRAGKGSGIAGDWRSVRETMNSPYPFRVTAFEGDGLAFFTGLSKKTQNVKFDGRDYPNEGPFAAGASSSARQVDERTLVITDKADGKVADTETIGLSADLKILTITTQVPGSDRPSVMVFERT
jgi:hypothetical protein